MSISRADANQQARYPNDDRRGGGAIINLSSIDGLRAGSTADIHYSAAKGGVVALTKNMAVHHGRDNIRVNAIAPGHLYASLSTGFPTNSESCAAAPLRWGRRGQRGMSLGRRCSWRATKRAGFPVSYCRLSRAHRDDTAFDAASFAIEFHPLA